MTDAEVRIKRPKICIFILSKRKDNWSEPSLPDLQKICNPCVLSKKQLYTGRYFSLSVLNSILDVEKRPWTCLNYCKFFMAVERVFLRHREFSWIPKNEPVPRKLCSFGLFYQLLQISSTVFSIFQTSYRKASNRSRPCIILKIQKSFDN